jgi:lipopolysaccharide/colanic/teichoic acid biosynthesis glycosyltransferase
MDAKYAKSWTVCGDLLVILKTPFAVIRGEGAM